MAVSISLGGALERELGGEVPDCSACGLPAYKSNRQRWGCDGPRDAGLGWRGWKIACGCGTGCEQCESGWRRIDRCPHALLREEAGPLAEFFRSWSVYHAHGILPGPGGYFDQPTSWLQACAVADHEKGKWDAERDENMRQERERVQARAKAEVKRGR